MKRLEGWLCGRERETKRCQTTTSENLLIKRSEVHPMRRTALLAVAAIGLGLASPVGAEAKGCIKGAIAGGVAGHYAGHHGFLGAVSGCIAGRHTARRTRAHPPNSVPDTSKAPR